MSRTNISLMRIVSALLLFSAALVYQASADDAVGIRRIDVGTNSTVEIVMPFSPLHNSGPDGYLAGSFFGDGTDISDCLSFYDLETGESIDSLWADSFWLDPVTLTPSMISPVPGDIFYFSRSNLDPFSFYIYGRLPEVPFRSTAPKIKSVLIDPVATSVEFSVFTRGLTIDIFVADFNSDGDESPSWSRLARYPASAPTVDFRDEISSMQSTRLYFAADATRDLDGDGLSDMMELLIYGTSPSSLDTDSDGLIDSLELAWGYNPLSHSGITPMSVFSESFEPPKVVEGSLLDQNGWITDETYDWSVVDKGLVFEGVGALKLNNSYVEHSVTSAPQVVWVDSYIYAESGSSTSKVPEGLSAFFFFDDDGHPVVSDGEMLVTNYLYSVSAWKRWVRCTSRLDFATKKWDFYLDSVLVASNLSLRGSTDSLSALAVEGEGSVDNITVTTERPVGLSSDGDYLADEWEIANFGDLSRDGSLDFDGDGLSDLEEFRAVTNPLLLNVDTDSDGLPDWWEIENGLNPTNAVYAKRIIFAETFESPDVVLGDISGQKEWAVTRSNLAVVQKSFTHDGSAALEMKGGKVENAENLELSHTSPSRADIVWMDVWCRAASGYDEADLTEGAFASFSFNDSGNPVLLDGDVLVTNTAVRIDDDRHWVRCSSRFDFSKRRWDFYLNGVLVSEGLSMHGTTGSLNSFGVEGGSAWIDDVYIGVSRPMGLSSDGDAMPDEWEFKYFGDLTRDGSEDFDNDGLSDEDEALALTNPLLADTDGDGMSDVWEVENNLKPLDASDAALDPDGDGYSNLEEFELLTNPWIADADGDGMLDIWEIKNGTNPFVADAFADPDGDGLVNQDEMKYGTNPLVADTDGDGCPDKTEVTNTRGNPLVADIVWSPVNVRKNVSASSFVSSTGTWRTGEDGTVFAAERAGSLTWRLTVPEGGADALALRVGQHNLYAKIFTFDLSLKVDGVFVTRELVSAQYGEKGEVYFFLPEIPHGEYEFTITWHNWEVNTFLSVYDLRFVKFNGIDSDFDGVADWKEHRSSTSSAIDALPCESLVSPLCIEGRDLWRDVLEINVDYPETNAVFAAVKTIGDGFYADIPLPLNGSAVVSMKDRSLSGSFPVAWKDFDVFAENYITNALLVRAGDSLKIAPHEDGESEITISISNGENSWIALTNWTASTSMPYCFETNGLYLVEVSRHGILSSKSGYAFIDAISSRFPMRNPAILMDMSQKLSCPDLSPRNILEHDSDLRLEAEVQSGGVELSLATSVDRNLGMVSRLSEDGAISDAVQVTPVWADNGTYYRVAENYSDGSQLIVVSLLLGAITDGMTVDLEIFASGVTFEDGTRFKTLTKDDFDENGHCVIRFIRARGVTTSVCHRTYIYQDGKLIYTNK